MKEYVKFFVEKRKGYYDSGVTPHTQNFERKEERDIVECGTTVPLPVRHVIVLNFVNCCGCGFERQINNCYEREGALPSNATPAPHIIVLKLYEREKI